MFNIQRHCFKFMNLIIIILQFMLKRLNSIKILKRFKGIFPIFQQRDRCHFFYRGCNLSHSMFLSKGKNFLICFSDFSRFQKKSQKFYNFQNWLFSTYVFQIPNVDPRRKMLKKLSLFHFLCFLIYIYNPSNKSEEFPQIHQPW